MHRRNSAFTGDGIKGAKTALIPIWRLRVPIGSYLVLGIRLLQAHGTPPLGEAAAPKTARVARSTCGDTVLVGRRPPDPKNPALTMQAVNLPRRRMNRWATR